MELLETIAYEHGLDLIETTSDASGYPRGLKYAIIGFETFDEAQELADRYGLTVREFTKRDGWQLWVRGGRMFGEYDYEEVWRNELNADIEVYKPGDENEVLEELKYFLGCCDRLDSMRCFIDNAERVLDELNKCEDNQFVVTNCGEFEGAYDCKVMSYAYDSSRYAIGIAE